MYLPGTALNCTHFSLYRARLVHATPQEGSYGSTETLRGSHRGVLHRAGRLRVQQQLRPPSNSAAGPVNISLFPFSVHEGSKSWKNWRDTQLGRLRMVHFEYPKLSYLWKFSTFGYLLFPFSVHEGSKRWKNFRDTQLGRLQMVQFEYPKLNYLLTFSSFGYIPFPIFSS